uniref:Capsid protein n=1 Tax=Alphatorquevirus homin9 TaxID=3048433 RepID=A0AAU8H8A1_9VIRU
MAWGWWRRRRKWWWRRRFARGRLRRRRIRRPRRRTRRRTVRRRRQWRRGRPRRRLFKRKRRFKRRRRKAKIKITQWQPSSVKRCFVIGYFPLVICGPGRWSENFTSHIEDRISKGPFGGGHSTSRWSLKVLYEEFQKHHNFWTRSNKELELVRFFGSTWRFYRHEDTDYIVYYSRKAPLGGNLLTAPSLHPGAAMLSKHKIIVPSFKTRPGGKPTVKINIKPPTTLIDKWYFQKDICDTTFLNLNVVLCNLRFPFCSPQTDNICVTFQILHEVYHNFISITAAPLLTATTWQKYYENFLDAAFPTERSVNKLNTFSTEGAYSHPQIKKFQQNITGSEEKYFRDKDGLWGDPIHITDNQDLAKVKTIIINNAKNYLKKVQQEYKGQENLKNLIHPVFCQYVGIFGSPLLNFNRISPEIPGLYKDIIYNPLTDKGIGNRVWIDYLSKGDTKYNPTQSKCCISDLPMWMACFGLVDWCKKETGNWEIPPWARIVMICPYTYPKLYNTPDPESGFIPIGYNFSQGLMPDGSKYTPIQMRHRWYPNLLNQQAVLEDISQSGPFSYREKTNTANINAKYKFRFHFGGNPVSEQIVADPCKQPTFEMPGTSTLPPRLQVTDPKLLGPHYTFHSWDKRRDYYNGRTIKRMSEQQETSEFLFPGPKKPRVDLDAVQPVEKDSLPQKREQRPWETSESEKETEALSEEEETGSVHQQLRQQLKEQKQLRQGINCLFEQLIKTQQGVHLDPSLL